MKIYTPQTPEVWRIEFGKNGEKYAYLRLTETSEYEIISLLKQEAASLPFDVFSGGKMKLRCLVRKLLDGGKYTSGQTVSFLTHYTPSEFCEHVEKVINRPR